MHYYCTYFDERYLVKGVTFIESLQKHDAACTIFVLCLDQKTKNVLDTLALPNVVTHLLNELEVENPDFHALRDSRTLVEYYWTMTPVVINYFFKYVPQNEILTYTDSDLFFFSSTDPIFQELQDYSVGIHGHNFPPCYKHLEKFGHYNVGWVSFRKDVEGEKVLAWWRKHCLKCCPYTIQTDSSGMICYGDQKYLDYFKDQSEQVHVFENIGVGVGPWNQIGYKISSDSDGTPCVNDIKTIFYHFHSYFQIAPNCDVPSNPDYSYTRESLVLFSIPYHEALQKSYQKILRVDPQYNANFNTSAAKAGSVFLLKGDAINIFANEGFNKIIKLEGDYALLAETNSPQESTSQTCVTNPTPISEEDTSPYPLPQQNYTGDYPDWETALKMTSGYDSDIILEKHLAAARAVKNGSALWERDSVVFHKPEVRQPLLNQLLHIAQQSDSHLHLLDFGGSFGSTYQQHRPYLIQIKDLSWNVVEQKHIVQIGQQEFQSERLKFFDSIEDVLTATKNNINAALFSGSIQYLDEPYFYLEKIVANKIPYIIFDRLTLLPDAAPQRDRISIQRVSPSIYDASYPCWWFSKEKLEAFLHKHGYDISKWHPSACDADGQWCALAQLKDPSSKLKSNTSERTPTCCIKEKPTLLQVDLFYPTYLDDFYRRQPQLQQKTCAEQLNSLIKDAFSGIHVFAPYLSEFGVDGQYFVLNSIPLAQSWLSENGYQPLDFYSQTCQADLLRLLVDHIKPDALYIASPCDFDTTFLNTLKHKPKVIMGWQGASFSEAHDLSGYDVILSGMPRLLSAMESLGAKKGVMFHPGVPDWLVQEIEAIEQDTDVVFVGSIIQGQHMARLKFLEEVAAAATQNGFSLALHLSCHPSLISPVLQQFIRPAVFGLEMHKALRRGRIVIDHRGHHALIATNGSDKEDIGGEDTINMRMFEATAGESLLITDALQGLIRYFEPEREIVTYKDSDDAVQKILYYLKNDAERIKIAKAGKARCFRDHNMYNRANAFARLVLDELSAK